MQKFVADSMLGKLAKWMIAAGFDVVFKKNSSREFVISIAKEQERIILTRDLAIKESDVVFVESDNFREQIEQVFKLSGIPSSEKAFTRCLDCNIILIPADKDEVEGKVPPYVFKTHRKFLRCPQCDKIFWKGSHYDRMKEILEKFRKI